MVLQVRWAGLHPPLACTVRGCGRALTPADQRLICPSGHAFDVARSGYVSLLQPQDRRSPAAGDSKEAVAARSRLVHAGVGRAAIDAIVEASRVVTSQPLVAADLGCGSGELLGALAAARDVCGVGIDLSAAAAGAAARRFPNQTWVVANADRRLPLLDASVHLVLSLNGRRNPDECARVLAPGGALIVAVPAPDDLIELRAYVQGEGVTRERAGAVVTEHAARFDVATRATVRMRHRLEKEALRDLLRGTYRGARTSAADRVQALESLDVTVASEIVVLSPRRNAV
jgi:23S rRNA (guanine745-N1)-methyltransferase